MSRYGYLLPDHQDAEDREQDDEPRGNTCNRCKATGLDWIHTGVRWRLQEANGKLHVCRAVDASDDFGVVK